MVDSIANILPINIIGVVSGTSAVGTPTDIFSRAVIQNVVIVNEDPISVKIFGSVVAATGTFSESLTISGLPVATSDDVTALQIAISGVEASDVDALTVSGGATIAGTIDFVGSGGTNLSSAGQIITIDTSGLQSQIDAVEASDVDALTVSGGAGVGGTIDLVGSGGTNVSRSGQIITITSADVAGGLNNVVEDTTPELGGNLDALSNDITGVNAFTAVTGTFSTGLTVGTGTVHIFPDEIEVEDMIVTGNLTVSGVPISGGGGDFTGLVESPLAVVIAPEDKTYAIDTFAQYAYDIIESRQQTITGSLITSVEINGTVIEGLDNVTVSGLAESSTATSANSVGIGDRVVLMVSGTSSGGGLSLEFGLKTVRT